MIISATAKCPIFGFAFLMISWPENFLFQDSFLTSSDPMKSWKYIGVLVFQTPCGPLKSGMPDSVLIPAPVNITIFLASLYIEIIPGSLVFN